MSLSQKALSKNDWKLESIDGLQILRSPLLRQLPFLTHAFSTRHGGKSRAPLDSFNLGRHWDCPESKEDAMNNRRRFCRVLKLDHEKLAVPSQKHTANVFLIDSDTCLVKDAEELKSVDALLSPLKGQPILLHFADCVPVILVDSVQEIVSVIHAGWRGTAAGIVKRAVEQLCHNFSSKPGDILAAIGPAIGSCCYETGTEVIEGLKTQVNESESLFSWRNERAFPDLKAFNALQLLESGVENLDVASWCTACNPHIFYSHRQSGGRTGRQGAIACLL